MDKEKLLKLVNEKYLEKKMKRFGWDTQSLAYKAPEQLAQLKVRSDQVKSLIEVIADFI